MADSPYAIPVDDLLASARVPRGELVEEQAESRPVGAVWPVGAPFYGDGASGDADGE